MADQTAYEGRCHCGAIGYRYSCTTPPSEWAIRACQCRFCRTHDALSTSDPAGTIAFEANDPDQLQRYIDKPRKAWAVFGCLLILSNYVQDSLASWQLGLFNDLDQRPLALVNSRRSCFLPLFFATM